MSVSSIFESLFLKCKLPANITMNAYFDCSGLPEVKGVGVALQKPPGKMRALTHIRKGLVQANGITWKCWNLGDFVFKPQLPL